MCGRSHPLIKRFIQMLLGQVRSCNEQLVRQISEQSLAAVIEQAQGRLVGMTVAEARGYVRAKATQIVLRETRLAIANSTEVEFCDMATIARQATERLIPQVIRKAHSGQQTRRVAA
jgi:hypothetical protein